MKAFSVGISETLHSILKQSSLTLRLLNVYTQAKGETKNKKKRIGLELILDYVINNSGMCKVYRFYF